jgi:3-oxoacyl-[acyl-carrier-protein] synthase III
LILLLKLRTGKIFFMKKAKIIGTGSYLPERILTNEDLEKMVDTTSEWIVTRTGMKERRIAKEDEYTSHMGYNAAKKAIDDAGIMPEDIDIILLATLTPDYIFPSSACLVQKLLTKKTIPALDIQAACSGYIYGLSLAKAYIESGCYKNILVVTAEKLSSIVDYKDRSTCVLFGDGASACVVSDSGPGLEIKSISLGADGTQSDLLKLPAGGSKHPASHDTVDKGMHYIHMAGNEVFKHAVRRMEMSSKECLNKSNINEEDISWLIPHQANLRIIEAIAKRFKHLPPDRVYTQALKDYGNTSASTIGIALDQLKKDGRIMSGENILLTVFGAGLTWGSAILTNNEDGKNEA